MGVGGTLTNDEAGGSDDEVATAANFHSYFKEDLNQIFFDAGFEPGPTTRIVAYSSKTMSWVKPEGGKVIGDVR